MKDAARCGDRDGDRRIACARPCPNREAHLRPAEVPRPGGVANEVIRGFVVGIVIVFGLVRTTVPMSDGCRCAGRDRLVEADPGCIGEEAAEAAARPDLDDRKVPAELAQPLADRLTPACVADRPDVRPDMVEYGRRRLLDELLCCAVPVGD